MYILYSSNIPAIDKVYHGKTATFEIGNYFEGRLCSMYIVYSRNNLYLEDVVVGLTSLASKATYKIDQVYERRK